MAPIDCTNQRDIGSRNLNPADSSTKELPTIESNPLKLFSRPLIVHLEFSTQQPNLVRSRNKRTESRNDE